MGNNGGYNKMQKLMVKQAKLKGTFSDLFYVTVMVSARASGRVPGCREYSLDTRTGLILEARSFPLEFAVSKRLHAKYGHQSFKGRLLF